MKTINLTHYECELVAEALVRAAARRNSMAKVALAERKMQEHSETAAEMIKLIARFEKAKAA